MCEGAAPPMMAIRKRLGSRGLTPIHALWRKNMAAMARQPCAS